MVSIGGLAVCVIPIDEFSTGLADPSSSEKSSTVTPGTVMPSLLLGSNRTVELPDLCLRIAGPAVAEVPSCPSTGEAIAAVFQLSFDSAEARSSGMTSVFGGSSFRDSQPTGGLGGGEIKKSFWDSGAWRC